MTPWQEHIGVGERQPVDRIVTDGTRTHRVRVEHTDHGRTAGYQTEHRSGRVDATVTPEPIRVTVAGKSKEVIVHG
jgi:hypothetical protein